MGKNNKNIGFLRSKIYTKIISNYINYKFIYKNWNLQLKCHEVYIMIGGLILSMLLCVFHYGFFIIEIY
jgi:hypothetical protein